jgi:hypothetical protein
MASAKAATAYKLPPGISPDRVLVASKSIKPVVAVAKKLIKAFVDAKVDKSSKIGFVFDVDDTLIRDDDSPIAPVVELYHWIGSTFKDKANRAIVTARADRRDMRETTFNDLRLTGIGPAQTDLMVLCPDRLRESSATIGTFKKCARQVFRSDHLDDTAPIVLTVGDQWTDMTGIPDDVDVMSYTNDLAMLVRLNGRTDGVCVWGLKLPATD